MLTEGQGAPVDTPCESLGTVSEVSELACHREAIRKCNHCECQECAFTWDESNETACHTIQVNCKPTESKASGNNQNEHCDRSRVAIPKVPGQGRRLVSFAKQNNAKGAMGTKGTMVKGCEEIKHKDGLTRAEGWVCGIVALAEQRNLHPTRMAASESGSAAGTVGVLAELTSFNLFSLAIAMGQAPSRTVRLGSP